MMFRAIFRILLLIFIIAAGALHLTNANAQALPKLKIAPTNVTVSGVSAGAMMAAQLLLVASDKIAGAGVIAGGIPGCAQDDINKAQSCVKNSNQINVANLINYAKVLSQQGLIAPTSNLKNKKIYILNGTADTIVNPTSGKKLQEWAQNFMTNDRIYTKFDLDSGHGFPTLNTGNFCQLEALPWLNNCNYDTAGKILQFLAGANQGRSIANNQNLIFFDQTSYLAEHSMMDSFGYIYVPATCKSGGCALHIALHGCLQSPDFVQQQFILGAGYNEWAENNRVVVLYPTVKSGNGNPYGCWDWWGYTGHNYMTHQGPQIRSILNMIQSLEKPL